MTSTPRDDREDGSIDLAFCRKTGVLFQSFGVAMMLTTCCWWPVTSCTQQSVHPTETARLIPEIRRDAPPEQIWAMLGVTLSFLAGMGLAVVGLGLQQERPRAGRAAVFLTALAGLFFWCYLGFAVFRFPAIGRIAVVAVMACFWTLCLLLAGASAEALKRRPRTGTDEAD